MQCTTCSLYSRMMTCLKMTNLTKYHHFQACRKWPNMITSTEFNASNHPGGPQGWLRWVITRSIIFKSFSDMIFKSSHFPIEIPIKNKKCMAGFFYWSRILKIFCWAQNSPHRPTLVANRVKDFETQNAFGDTLIYKNKNTKCIKHQTCAIFLKHGVQGYQIWRSPVISHFYFTF